MNLISRLTAAMAVLVAALILAACTTSDAGDGAAGAVSQQHFEEVLDELADGGILHMRTVQFTYGGTRNSLGSGLDTRRFEFTLPEHRVNDIWMLIGEDGRTLEFVALTSDEDGNFLTRTRLADGEVRTEHVPSGETETRSSGSDSPKPLIEQLKQTFAETGQKMREAEASGEMVREASGNDGTFLLVQGTEHCGRANDLPAGTVFRKQELRESDYAPVASSCWVVTSGGVRLLVESDQPSWEALDASQWDQIANFVFGGDSPGWRAYR